MSDGIFDLSKEGSIAATLVGPSVIVIGGAVLDYVIYRREQAGLDFLSATLGDPVQITMAYLGMNTNARAFQALQRHTYLTAAVPLALAYLSSLGVARYHSEKAKGTKSAANWFLGTAAYGSLFSTLGTAYAYYGGHSEITTGEASTLYFASYFLTGVVLGLVEYFESVN